MIIAKKTADELMTHLLGSTISIPELQEKMKVSYSDAHRFIEFAIKRRWLDPCAEGIDYKTNPSAFAPKSLNDEQCKKIYDLLGRDELKVLFYFLQNHAPSFHDIIKDVDDDEDDMHEALENLIVSNILAEFHGTYYCNIANESIEKIQGCQKCESPLSDHFRKMMRKLDEGSGG